jgi:hypothetical protein
MPFDQRFALEAGQRLAAFICTFAPHANDVAVIGATEALYRRRVLAKVCF